VVAPAIDNKAEGYVLGVGAKIFTVAGPVILYGTLASVVYGIVCFVKTALLGVG
jgi:stage V sporulation protein AC